MLAQRISRWGGRIAEMSVANLRSVGRAHSAKNDLKIKPGTMRAQRISRWGGRSEEMSVANLRSVGRAHSVKRMEVKQSGSFGSP